MNIALIFVQDALLCLRRDGAQWRSMPVEGEPAISLMHFSAGRLQEVLRSKRHEQTVAECVITVLHHPQSAALASTCVSALLDEGYGRVDSLALAPWTALLNRLEGVSLATTAADADAGAYARHLLPLLDACLLCLDAMPNAPVSASAAADSPEDSALAELQQLNQALHAENLQLRQTLAEHTAAHEQSLATLRLDIHRLNLRLLDQDSQPIHQLLPFFSLFFREFWGKIRPDELAMLLGLKDVPQIASVYHEPSGEALAILRRDWSVLPEASRMLLLGWVKKLSLSWDVRPEMRKVLEQMA